MAFRINEAKLFLLHRSRSCRILKSVSIGWVPPLISTPRHEAFRTDILQGMILYEVYHLPKCTFTQFTSKWKRPTPLRITYSVHFDGVRYQTYFADSPHFILNTFLNEKNISVAKTIKFPLSGEHSIWIHW